MATRPPVTVKPINRARLAAFLGNQPDLIRAFESLAEDVANVLPDAAMQAQETAEEAADDAASALAAAQAAQQAADDALAAAIAARLPVGAIHVTVNPTNPATTLGYGTWVAFGQGRVLVGVDTTDPDFDTVEETGGSKTAAI